MSHGARQAARAAAQSGVHLLADARFSKPCRSKPRWPATACVSFSRAAFCMAVAQCCILLPMVGKKEPRARTRARGAEARRGPDKLESKATFKDGKAVKVAAAAAR